MSVSARLKSFLDSNQVPYESLSHSTTYTAQGTATVMQILSLSLSHRLHERMHLTLKKEATKPVAVTAEEAEKLARKLAVPEAVPPGLVSFSMGTPLISYASNQPVRRRPCHCL